MDRPALPGRQSHGAENHGEAACGNVDRQEHAEQSRSIPPGGQPDCDEVRTWATNGGLGRRRLGEDRLGRRSLGETALAAVALAKAATSAGTDARSCGSRGAHRRVP
jgi:hypothetical protein